MKVGATTVLDPNLTPVRHWLDDDDLVRAHDPCALYGAEAKWARAEYEHVSACFDRHAFDREAETSRHHARQQ